MPNDIPKDGYSVWIGRTGFRLVRPPWEDTSTLNLNHVVMGVCFSGQRQDGIPGEPAFPVTDEELGWVRDACSEARRLGWLSPLTPEVTPHDNLAGSATVCPGTRVYARWHDVYQACLVSEVPAPAPEDDMEFYPAPKNPHVNKLFGALIDLSNSRVVLYGGAKIDQDTIAGTFWGPPNPNKILTSYAESGGFAVATSDSDLYHLHWA